MTRRVFVGVDLAKAFHLVAAVDADQVLVAPPFQVLRGREGLEDLLARLRFLVHEEPDLVFTIEASSWTRIASWFCPADSQVSRSKRSLTRAASSARWRH